MDEWSKAYRNKRLVIAVVRGFEPRVEHLFVFVLLFFFVKAVEIRFCWYS